MTLGLTHKTGGNSATSPGTAASVAFQNKTLYIVSVGAVCAVGNTATFTAPTGGGLTFVSVKASSVARRGAAMWCAYVDSGATTDTLSIGVTTGSLNRLMWSIEEVTGSAGTNATSGLAAFGVTGAQNDTTSTACSVTLAAFADAVNNVAIGNHAANQNATLTAEGGYIALVNQTQTTISQLVEYVLGQDTTVTATCTNVAHASVAAELIASMVTGTGAFAAAAVSFSGTGTETITGTGALAAAAASLAGVGTSGSASSTTSGGGAPFYDITPVSQLPPPVLISGSGSFAAAPASLAGVMDVGPDPRIAMWHREDEELLRMLP